MSALIYQQHSPSMLSLHSLKISTRCGTRLLQVLLKNAFQPSLEEDFIEDTEGTVCIVPHSRQLTAPPQTSLFQISFPATLPTRILFPSLFFTGCCLSLPDSPSPLMPLQLVISVISSVPSLALQRSRGTEPRNCRHRFHSHPVDLKGQQFSVRNIAILITMGPAVFCHHVEGDNGYEIRLAISHILCIFMNMP